jgi:hypothetical protein
MGLTRESYFYIGWTDILTCPCCAGIQSASIRISFGRIFYWLNDILHRTINMMLFLRVSLE